MKRVLCWLMGHDYSPCQAGLEPDEWECVRCSYVANVSPRNKLVHSDLRGISFSDTSGTKGAT